MQKMRYARFKFTVRKNVMTCVGQRQTRRGTYYPADLLQVSLADKSAAALKKAMAQGIEELCKNSQIDLPL